MVVGVGAAGLGVFLREGMRLGEALGSFCGASLIQVSCCADREIEAQKKTTTNEQTNKNSSSGYTAWQTEPGLVPSGFLVPSLALLGKWES